MNCTESQTLLSAFYDDELDQTVRVQVELHSKECSLCSTDLRWMGELTAAVHRLPQPSASDDIWNRIENVLDAKMTKQSMNHIDPKQKVKRKERSEKFPWNRRGFIVSVSWVTAATLLFGLGVAWHSDWHSSADHEPLEKYVQQFTSSPTLAQRELTEAYSGRKVTADEAVQLVGYHGANIQTPPSGFTQDSLYVLDMPCCKCIQANWRRADGSCIAIFEHKKTSEPWFGNQPSRSIDCAGRSCRIVETGTQFAATWSIGDRMVTVVGLHNTDELNKIVETLS
ncbi:zf-HC2 domain-containing protein [Novipirellula artificiosorum]|uniref:Uncharacterized protein n=1 Tax=Novipirellula artificiosorum TaxID=2528016 RepID=A0A5C6DVH4_9BACT|nr:zf-HC2 domain-containing protein [Novipirellula artificiosorum]TWU39441.1 hypothetical protein Poly41_22650 [Novipirellula artificiosorum]